VSLHYMDRKIANVLPVAELVARIRGDAPP
jgi:hypothetical protein